ncbi:MAG: 30S ribosomal protein S15 [Spirochaetes bacterium GWD1_61_31]|nr:MAG: 30S ribosomal protein S15 [Spirochaetes bacterium GWB1_60_80]OHD35102.1 MAG: 30S ribosomal protein S15 [Spirochaetes bacterium GWC1_61_12]OHD43620.1 MAG: 30S ribosomal protein S15 [Spirochaetes bacterium GWD1_61_31]OHD44112.1 MAG: 30S ribosomal protein S15 [Spirochaetes bacterium GWE1_60_18]OHD61847.1 MAG: 30S ribosomal protein S15 [Spirochaetes bacterium GWF1_60_12]HAW85087.1 30S ribosomal protein S15 [Spirochaetaceae bacterium]
MAVTKEDKSRVVKEFGGSEKNTGAADVQVALLSEHIGQLTEHFKVHKKDTNSKRGLLKMIGQRRRLLKYIQRTDLVKYRELIQRLNLRK